MTLSEAVRRLTAAGDTDAAVDARLFFARYGGFSPADLYGADPSSDSDVLADAVERRAGGEPTAYILGDADFYGETYFVTPDVLIPRTETELVADYAVHRLPRGGTFLDLCTGSGCIALSVLRHTESTRAAAADISDAALAVARKNAEKYALTDRISFVRSDVLRDVLPGTYDMIVSNPPYVEDAVYPTLEREIFHEPRTAFVGGAEGMDFYRAIVSNYRTRLTADGFFLFEIGFDQGERMTALAEKNNMACDILPDFSGLDRIAVLKRKNI